MANENLLDVAEPAPAAAPAEAASDLAPPRAERKAIALEQELSETLPDARNLDLLLDVNLKVTVELGRSRLKIRDVLNLAAGSIVELGKPASEPVDILVNGALLASGEVVVVDGNFAVRITKLLSRAERLKKLF